MHRVDCTKGILEHDCLKALLPLPSPRCTHESVTRDGWTDGEVHFCETEAAHTTAPRTGGTECALPDYRPTTTTSTSTSSIDMTTVPAPPCLPADVDAVTEEVRAAQSARVTAITGDAAADACTVLNSLSRRCHGHPVLRAELLRLYDHQHTVQPSGASGSVTVAARQRLRLQGDP